MMRKIFCMLAVCTVMLSLAGTSHATVTGLNGYQVTELFSTVNTYTTISGLDLYNGQLYFGQYTEIKSLDLTSLNDTVLCTIPSNAGIPIVIAKPDTGTIYTAYGSSYSSPYPYAFGTIDTQGNFNSEATFDGLFDAALDSNGNLYFTANPGTQGTKVLRYDWVNKTTETIVDMGGSSGGLCFDDEDNLYLADYDHSQILSFSASNIATVTSSDPLEVADADDIIAFDGPGYLAVDSANNHLYVSYSDSSWHGHLARINLDNTSERLEVTDGGGKMVINDAGDLYMIDTDWDSTSPTYYSSSINLVAAPEPSTIVLLLAGLVSLAMLRRR